VWKLKTLADVLNGLYVKSFITTLKHLVVEKVTVKFKDGGR